MLRHSALMWVQALDAGPRVCMVSNFLTVLPLHPDSPFSFVVEFPLLPSLTSSVGENMGALVLWLSSGDNPHPRLPWLPTQGTNEWTLELRETGPYSTAKPREGVFKNLSLP